MTDKRFTRTTRTEAAEHSIDRTAAEEFLTRLDGQAERWTFQTFDDNGARKSRGLARILHGTLCEHFATLSSLNRRGAGVFVTINQTDGRGRARENIVRIRSLWQEDDGAGRPLPLEPQIVVETSPEKFHRYLLVEGMNFDDHQTVQTVLVQQYGSDPGAKDIARVLRVPGFFHLKAKPNLVRVAQATCARPYSRAAVLRAFRLVGSTTKAVKPVAEEIIPEGQRNTTLTSLAGMMRRRGISRQAIEAALKTENDARCRPALSASEVATIARSVSRYAPVATTTPSIDPVERAIEAASTGDAGAPFEPEALEALRRIRDDTPAEYFRLRNRLKKANTGVPLTELDRAVRQTGEDDTEPPTGADALVALVRDRAELFRDANGIGYASVRESGHREIWALDSRPFQEWLAACFYRKAGKAPREAALKDATSTLAGIARFTGEDRKVWLRVARENDRYWLDLCNADWQAVEVTNDGWQVLDLPRVQFRRTATMRTLPYPECEGNLERLWESVNIAGVNRPLVLAWMLECWRPETHTPVLELGGEQGSGKSETQARLRDLIDPNEVSLRAAPIRIEDMFVTARNNWLVSFNNLSRLTAPQQDALCVLSTGGGFAARTLYSNTEETAFNTLRPVVMNGIAPLATAQDLVDRVVRIELPPIEARQPGSQLAAKFEATKPRILGALLDLFSATLQELPRVSLDDPPRMADFARLGEAMFRALGRQDSFTALYRARGESAVLAALDASPVAAAVLDLMDTAPTWSGPTKALLETLAGHRLEAEAWPRSPRGLADALRRAAPGLRLLGIRVTFEPVRRKDGYHITLGRQRREADAPPESSSAENLPVPDNIHQVHHVHPMAGKNPAKASNRPFGECGELGEHRSRPRSPESGQVSPTLSGIRPAPVTRVGSRSDSAASHAALPRTDKTRDS